MGPKTPQSTEKRKRNVLTLPKKIELVRRREKAVPSYVLGLYLAEKGTRLSGIFDYPEAAKSHDSRIIGTCLYNEALYMQIGNEVPHRPPPRTKPVDQA